MSATRTDDSDVVGCAPLLSGGPPRYVDPMRVLGAGQVDPSRLEALEQSIASHRLTEHVMRGLTALGGELEDVVEQDEFTIDLVVRLSDGLFLVYDTT